MKHPIFDMDNLNSSELSKALNTFGCALIKQVFPPEILSIINQRARAALAYRQTQFNERKLPEAYQKFYRIGWVPFISIREIESPEDRPFQLLYLFSQSCLPRLILDYYKSPSVFVDPGSTVIRRVGLENKEMLTPFHQDGLHKGGAFPVLTGQPMLNCWFPLNSCGQDSPSLEVIALSQSEQFPFSNDTSHPLYKNQALDSSWVLKNFAKYQWQPEYELGDVMLMTQFTIHKTYATPTMTKDRLSIEIRSVPNKQLPNLSTQGLFKIEKELP